MENPTQENNVSSAFAELESMFQEDDNNVKKFERIILDQNLEGFASCFPDWDLHPPVSRK